MNLFHIKSLYINYLIQYKTIMFLFEFGHAEDLYMGINEMCNIAIK